MLAAIRSHPPQQCRVRKRSLPTRDWESAHYETRLLIQGTRDLALSGIWSHVVLGDRPRDQYQFYNPIFKISTYLASSGRRGLQGYLAHKKQRIPGTYSRKMPRALWRPYGGGLLLMSEVHLCGLGTNSGELEATGPFHLLCCGVNNLFAPLQLLQM